MILNKFEWYIEISYGSKGLILKVNAHEVYHVRQHYISMLGLLIILILHGTIKKEYLK